jgi:hypothetical protein
MTRSVGAGSGLGAGTGRVGGTGRVVGTRVVSGSKAGAVARARAPSVRARSGASGAPPPSRRGAAAPQRAWRLASAAVTSAGGFDTDPVSNKRSTSSTVFDPGPRPAPDRHRAVTQER